ncbi:hypothetical protein [Erwinia sp. JH02]|uniref:hypothetical protein n=1 Tax=Erwinia sp. JH02 TaxID=2733394 RepID=UPI00148961D1|nr:hypothetical protein [Erwinia sp. JH02]NNS09343.1 hypothetical protein [Erwinia sp. JH02]
MMAHQLVEVHKHLSLYRGFSISRAPRSPLFPRHRYIVTKDGNYFGQDFAQDEAINIIDQLCADQEKWLIKLTGFIPTSEITNVTTTDE